MTTALAEPILQPLQRCWICESPTLVPSHEERFELGLLAQEEEHREVLGPYEGTTFILNRCRDCGFMQPSGIPAHPRYFDALYDQKWSVEWSSSEFESTYKDVIFRIILAQLARLLGAAERTLLDIGAHVGRMVYLADRAGWQAEGIELNPRTAEFAAKRTGRPIHREDAATMAKRGSQYHAVVLTDVLEHIPNPVPVLSGLRKLLVPGGWIAVKVPHGLNQRRKELFRSWIGSASHAGIAINQVHVNHFNSKALRHALDRAGFDQITVGVGYPELFPGGGIRGKLTRLARRAAYHVGRLPGGLHTPLALNLQAFARKRRK